MPWVEEIDEVPQSGAPMVLVDNTDTIDDLLRDYNASVGWPRGCGSCRASGPGVPPAAWLGLAYGIGQFGAGISWSYFSLHLFGDAVAPLAAV